MPIEVKTYKEYLADEAEASKEYVGDHCFVAGCTNPPPYYKVGDERFCAGCARNMQRCVGDTWTTYEPSCCSAG